MILSVIHLTINIQFRFQDIVFIRLGRENELKERNLEKKVFT